MPSVPSPRRRSARRPCRAVADSAVVVGRLGFLTAGTWSGVGAGRRRGGSRSMSRSRETARGTCAGSRGGVGSMHDTAIGRDRGGRAVSRVPHMRSTARPRRIGSVVELCMPEKPRNGRGTTAPTLRCPPLSAPRPCPAGVDASPPARHGCRAEPALRDGPLGILASPDGPAAIPSGGRRAQRGAQALIPLGMPNG